MYTAQQLHSIRKKRLLKRKKHEKTTAQKYNPQVQKPVALEPLRFLNNKAHYFWGPPPDAGFSYGYAAYSCNNCKGKYVLTAGIEQYCPTCGCNIGDPVDSVDKKYIAQALSSSSFGNLLTICPSCTKKITTSITPAFAKTLKSVYCTQCGTSTPQALEALKTVAQDMYGDDTDEYSSEGQEDDVITMDEEDEEEEAVMVDPEDEALDDDIIDEGIDEGIIDDEYVTIDKEDDLPPIPEGEEYVEDDTIIEDETVSPKSEGGDKDEEEDDDDDALSMEKLTEYDELGALTVADINMVLFKGDSDNPYWDLYLKDQPTARVRLKDMPNHDEIKARFLDTKLFPQDVAKAIERFGCNEVMASMNFKPFAYKLDSGKLATRIRKQVEADFSTTRAKKLATLRDNYVKCIKVAAKAANLNFFKNMNNSLKESLYENMDNIGITDPTSIIEASFQKGQLPYIESLLTKAMDFMDMTPETFKEICAAINETNPIIIESPSDTNLKGRALAQKLTKNSIPLIGSTGKSIEASAQPVTIKALKNRISLGTRF